MSRLITERSLRGLLNRRFHGVIKQGQHEEDGECCVIELLSAFRKHYWTDNPDRLDTWDIRRINDIPVSDQLRTRYMVPLLVAYANSRTWHPDQQRIVVTQIAILSVNRLLVELPGLPAKVIRRCQKATTLRTATAAADQVQDLLRAREGGWLAMLATEIFAYNRLGRYDLAAKGAARLAADTAVELAERSIKALDYDDEAPTDARIFEITCQLWLEAARANPLIQHTV